MKLTKMINGLCTIIAVIVTVYVFMWLWTLYVMSDSRLYNDDFTRGVLRCTVGTCPSGSALNNAYTNYIAHVDSVDAKRRNQK